MAEQIIKGNLALICRAMFNHNDNLCSMLSNKSGSMPFCTSTYSRGVYIKCRNCPILNNCSVGHTNHWVSLL